MTASDAPSIFDDLVAVLEPAVRSVAPFMLTRLLLRAGVFERSSMSVDDLHRALPVLRAGFAESLSASDLPAVMSRLDGLVQRRRLEVV